MHKIIIIGNLGRDPEMRYTPNGDGVTSFSVASNRRYRTASGDQREETMWFNVSAWGRQAEICNQYLTRGSQVYIEGTLTTRVFQGNDGQPRVSNDVRMTEMQMLSSRNSEMGERSPYGGGDEGGMDDYGGGGGMRDRGYGGGMGGGADEVDDLPF